MNLIKMEPENDSLDLLQDNTYKLKENKASSEEGNLSHLEVMGMKAECMDHSSEIKSEIKVEDTPAPTTFEFVRCEIDVQEDLFAVARVQQEQKVEISSEEDEVLTEKVRSSHYFDWQHYYCGCNPCALYYFAVFLAVLFEWCENFDKLCWIVFLYLKVAFLLQQLAEAFPFCSYFTALLGCASC
ncbi:uncharacterized protein [Periplaneta americana]|uniref:uncharacterized protein isoform X3 n=1 Tax=Periplaneta americana TaxID=6978 RepID=UPI0037E85CC4